VPVKKPSVSKEIPMAEEMFRLFAQRGAERVSVKGAGKTLMSLCIDELVWHLQRMESKSQIRGECWVWTGYERNGYGSISVRNSNGYIHALSFAIAHGEPDLGNDVVRHSCDTRRCWNPAHLLEGTQLDNVHDAHERGRAVNPPRMRGISNHLAALKDEQVREIRSRAGEKQRDLAAEYGCSQSTVWRLIHQLVRAS
jgi:DNA-binding transcriptional regulator YiaG